MASSFCGTRLLTSALILRFRFGGGRERSKTSPRGFILAQGNEENGTLIGGGILKPLLVKSIEAFVEVIEYIFDFFIGPGISRV